MERIQNCFTITGKCRICMVIILKLIPPHEIVWDNLALWISFTQSFIYTKCAWDDLIDHWKVKHGIDARRPGDDTLEEMFNCLRIRHNSMKITFYRNESELDTEFNYKRATCSSKSSDLSKKIKKLIKAWEQYQQVQQFQSCLVKPGRNGSS